MVVQEFASKKDSRKYVYCLILCAFLFLIAALRSPSVGYDTRRYISHFKACSRLSWGDILTRYEDEPGFYLLAKFISLFTDNAQWMLAVIGLIFAGAIFKFIYGLSVDCQTSFLLLIPFQFYAFSLSGLRQAIAWSIVFVSYGFAKERKLWKFLLCIIAATIFHKSAMFSALIYFLYSIRMTRLKRLLFILMLPIIYFFKKPLLSYSLRWFYTDYVVYETVVGTLTTFFLYFIIWILYIYLCGALKKEQKSGFEPVFMAGIVLQMFVSYEPNIFRLAFYYQISSLIIVPEILRSPKITDRSRSLAYFAFWAVMFLMYFGYTYNAGGMNPYSFFWQ